MADVKPAGGARIALRAAALACLAGAAACAPFGAHSANSPGWFKSRLKDTEKQPFPKLASVPQATTVAPTRPVAEWDAIQSNVAQAGAALDASPRSSPPDQTEDATIAFEQQARKDVESKHPAN